VSALRGGRAIRRVGGLAWAFSGSAARDAGTFNALTKTGDGAYAPKGERWLGADAREMIEGKKNGQDG